MPNCFQLTKKGETEPTTLHKVDEELCRLLDVPVHDTYYVMNWYNTIGMWIATRDNCDLGSEKLWAVLEDFFDTEERRERKSPEKPGMSQYQGLKVCLDYLCENYTSRSWYQVGK